MKCPYVAVIFRWNSSFSIRKAKAKEIFFYFCATLAQKYAYSEIVFGDNGFFHIFHVPLGTHCPEHFDKSRKKSVGKGIRTRAWVQNEDNHEILIQGFTIYFGLYLGLWLAIHMYLNWILSPPCLFFSKVWLFQNVIIKIAKNLNCKPFSETWCNFSDMRLAKSF